MFYLFEIDYRDPYNDLDFTAVNQGFEAAAEPGLDARPTINTCMHQNTLVSMLCTVGGGKQICI